MRRAMTARTAVAASVVVVLAQGTMVLVQGTAAQAAAARAGHVPRASRAGSPASQAGSRAPDGSGTPPSTGSPWPLPAPSAPVSNLAVLGGGTQGQGNGQIAAAAVARARKTGQPVLVAGLTTATSSVTAEPDGHVVADSTALPVRVRRGAGWVPVNTSLRGGAGGRLVPVAVPGDTVSFSAGGRGPAAALSVPGSRLALFWPGRLPAPSVAESAATYRNVLPGVDLMLTATSRAAGGFSEVLVIRDRAAALDPRLARLGLRVSAPGTDGLRSVAGGGLSAQLTGGRGSFAAPAPVMWDSSTMPAHGAMLRAAVASARAVGAGLAEMGSGPGAVSSAAGPGGGARLASVTARVLSHGQVLSLVPDARMLASASTKFPVYIDPSFTSLTANGDRLDYDPVQSGSGCTGSHWDSPGWSPDGYDNFQTGPCTYQDTDRALYRLSLPNIFDSNFIMISASLQVTEVYGSACQSVPLTASLIESIHSDTGWPGPDLAPSNVDASATMPEDDGSCNNVVNTKDRVSTGFDVTPDMKDAASWPNITFRVWQPGSTNEADHVQLTDSPTLQITYTDAPNTPSSMAVSATNGGTGQVDCDTKPPSASNPAPAVAGDPYLQAVYGDEDGAAVRAKIQYWDYTHNGPVTTVDDAIDSVTTSEGQVGWQLPGSFVSGLADGTVVAWQAKAVTGSGTVGGRTYGPYYSPYSATCYFAVYPNGPGAPTVTPTATGPQPVNTALPVTLTAASGDPAAEFTWAVNSTPPSPTSARAAQTCATGTAEPACTAITNGTATLTVTVPAPGPEDLNVCAWDAAGNEACATATFSGKGDVGASYTSLGSLQQNFSAALGANASFDNTMISTKAGSPGGANGDGNSSAIDEAVLNAAGWAPSKTVTVDGATFTLPAYGTASSGPDNLLAANQTIGAGGVQGSTLVFLASSTNADVVVPGLATGSPNTIATLQHDEATPAVMGGVPVSGTNCEGQATFNATSSGCIPASGFINYNSTCSAGSQVPYYLTVPDWTAGPSDIAALSMGKLDQPTGQVAETANIYAFAVPLSPSCTLQSVTLPDVSPSVDPMVAPGVTVPEPALHILGMALRNTTTATPAVGGSVAAPSGQAWTGAFEAPADGAYGPPSGTNWDNQTMRVVLSPNVSASSGQLRIRMSNPGFVSGDGSGPLTIGHATVAQASANGSPGTGQATTLKFGGATSVTVPEGGDVYSDPVPLSSGLTVSAGKDLVVSLWLQNASVPDLPENTWSSGAATWFTGAGSGDHTADTSGSAFTTGPVGAVPLLTGLDVTTAGEPTVVVAGNNVIDGITAAPASDALDAPSQRLAGHLSALSAFSGYGVVDAGIQANQVLADGTTQGGVSLLARVDRDILAEPGVGTVVIDEGLEDLLASGNPATDEQNLQYAYPLLTGQLNAFGINVLVTNLTPCAGHGSACPDVSPAGAVLQARNDLNTSIGEGFSFCPVNIDGVVATASSLGTGNEVLASGDGTSDNVNLTLGASGGYNAIAQAVASAVKDNVLPCALAANSLGPPPP